MQYIHSVKTLPSQQAIQSVSVYSNQFDQKDFDFQTLLISLKETIFRNSFMIESDHYLWASTRGRDYLDNPKLFAQAPLTHVCAFIGEIFKNFDIDEINRRLPSHVLQKALIRLNSFCA